MLSSSMWLLIVMALADEPSDEVWPTDGWPESTPAEQGLDATLLSDLVDEIRAGERYPDIHGLLVVRHGRLVVEEYFGGYHRDRLHTLQSVTKSFTSAAVGIAIGRGEIGGVDDKVLGFFDDDEVASFAKVDDRKRAMTLRDLLTMRSGTDYHERGDDSPHFQLNRLRRGWTGFILSRPMIDDPGKTFRYDSGAVILTSRLIQQRAGEHADAYLEEHLFRPIGIEKTRWYTNDEGHPHTGGGLHLRPRDMARFGLLYLRGGRWRDRQVIPRDWVEESTRMHVQFTPKRGPFVGYGYWWWLLPPPERDDAEEHKPVYAASGFMGQYIFCAPEFDLVCVVTAGARGSDQNRPIDFLYSHVLPSVKE